jgi:hypothetical protein
MHQLSIYSTTLKLKLSWVDQSPLNMVYSIIDSSSMIYNTLNMWYLLNSIYTPTAGWCPNCQTTTYEITLPLKLRTEFMLLCCCCCAILLLLLLLGTLSNIVPHLSKIKTSHFSHVSFLPTTTLLWLCPTLGTLSSTLTDLPFSLCVKRKILLTLSNMFLASISRARSHLLLHEVIPESLLIGNSLPGHNALHKSLPRFGEAI